MTENDRELLVDYLVVGREVGEDGTPHLQGYCCFKNRKRLTAVKKIWPRAHLEPKGGTPQEASDYCKKDDDFDEYGDLPTTLKIRVKRDWDEAFELAKNHKMDEIPKNMLIPYYHAFKRIQQDYPRKLDDLPGPCGIWITGPSGSGKSWDARHNYGPYYLKTLNKWWDGYRDEDLCIVEDISPKEAERLETRIKWWTDEYPFPSEQKGSHVVIRPKQVIFTSQYTLDECFQNQKTLVALKRRFMVINKVPRLKQMKQKRLERNIRHVESLIEKANENHKQLTKAAPVEDSPCWSDETLTELFQEDETFICNTDSESEEEVSDGISD